MTILIENILIDIISSLSLFLIGFFTGSMYELRKNLSQRLKSISTAARNETTVTIDIPKGDIQIKKEGGVKK